MRKMFNEEILERVSKITGLTDDRAYYMAGAAYATCFIGKLPVREDLACYLDIGTKNPIFRSLTAENVYPVAADLILKGLYFDNDGPEPIERTSARLCLNGLVNAKDIKKISLFSGMNIMLDYLWRSSGESIKEFVDIRYENCSKSMSKLLDFVLYLEITDNLSHEFQSNVEVASRYLLQDAMDAHRHLLAASSARTARKRVRRAIAADSAEKAS